MATCAACGYEAAGSFSFSPECGARADGRAREQRKVVTVLFCDVAGSTALGESLDAEAVRALLARYFERMKSIVERHGDAVMAVFGLPAVYEDDAVRALRAAAERQAAMPALGIEGRIGAAGAARSSPRPARPAGTLRARARLGRRRGVPSWRRPGADAGGGAPHQSAHRARPKELIRAETPLDAAFQGLPKAERAELDRALALCQRKGNLVMAERTRSRSAELTASL